MRFEGTKLDANNKLGRKTADAHSVRKGECVRKTSVLRADPSIRPRKRVRNLLRIADGPLPLCVSKVLQDFRKRPGAKGDRGPSDRSGCPQHTQDARALGMNDIGLGCRAGGRQKGRLKVFDLTQDAPVYEGSNISKAVWREYRTVAKIDHGRAADGTKRKIAVFVYVQEDDAAARCAGVNILTPPIAHGRNAARELRPRAALGSIVGQTGCQTATRFVADTDAGTFGFDSRFAEVDDFFNAFHDSPPAA